MKSLTHYLSKQSSGATFRQNSCVHSYSKKVLHAVYIFTPLKKIAKKNYRKLNFEKDFLRFPCDSAACKKNGLDEWLIKKYETDYFPIFRRKDIGKDLLILLTLSQYVEGSMMLLRKLVGSWKIRILVGRQLTFHQTIIPQETWVFTSEKKII